MICVPHFFSKLTLKVSTFSQLRIGENKVKCFKYFCFSASCLLEEVDTCPVLLLLALNSDTVLWHTGSPDAAVGLYCQCYGNPTFSVAACPRIGLFPLRCEVDIYAFKRSLCPHAEEAVHRNNKGAEVVALTESSLKVFFLFYFSAVWRHFSGDLFQWERTSVFTTLML